MKLRSLQQDIPPPNILSKRLCQSLLISQQCEGIEESKCCSNNKLRVFLSRKADYWTRDSGKSKCAYKCARYGAGEGEVVVGLAEPGDVAERDAKGYYVVCSLDIEGLFDFRVGSNEEVEEDEGRNYGEEDAIWGYKLAHPQNQIAWSLYLPIGFILNPPDTVFRISKLYLDPELQAPRGRTASFQSYHISSDTSLTQIQNLTFRRKEKFSKVPGQKFESSHKVNKFRPSQTRSLPSPDELQIASRTWPVLSLSLKRNNPPKFWLQLHVLSTLSTLLLILFSCQIPPR